MEFAVHSGRREERVPLDALIELRSDESDEVLEADGLDLSPGGLSMRAAFVPPVGARLKCQFRCSPEGERVRAEGEVVWSEAASERDGAFGMRFLALDTKSATAIRRHMEPEPEAQPEPAPAPPRHANMRIDGLGAAVATDVLYADAGSVVLEQELNFLKLGRAVSIDVPGRGTKRGRIGSVELRQGPLDVPSLVFGILLDAEPELGLSSSPRELPLEGERASRPAARELEPQAVSSSLAAVEAAVASVAAVRPKVRAASSTTGDTAMAAPESASTMHASAAADDLAAEAAPALWGLVLAWCTAQWSRLVPALRALQDRMQGRTQSLREERWPEAKSRLAVHFARARLFVAAQREGWARMRQTRQQAPRRATKPAPRVQRSSAATPRAADQTPGRAARPNVSRWVAVGLALLGVGLGVYALAPRSGADRIRVRRALPATEPLQEEQPQAPVPTTLGAESAVPAAAPAVVDPAIPAAAGSLSFGEPSVPNGRVFSLRMSGPVDAVEGESREDGFTVRVPGRLALDRASPIATSHRAVARAMILNRGDYAELTVDFLPGLRPKYQVTGKDNALEVTLERL